jgi:hypothetical protein
METVLDITEVIDGGSALNNLRGPRGDSASDQCHDDHKVLLPHSAVAPSWTPPVKINM